MLLLTILEIKQLTVLTYRITQGECRFLKIHFLQCYSTPSVLLDKNDTNSM